MNTKEFTLRKGFSLPILKALSILGKESTLREISDCLVKEGLFAPRVGDVEKIDFNEIVRFEYTVDSVLSDLVDQNLVSASGELFSISNSGTEKLENEWSNYNQNDFVKKVDIANKNKYIYFNIPPYLMFNGHKQFSVPGFLGYEKQYVKFLNDFIDYIDLNYPTMEEMIDFLKYNYDFDDNATCINAVNVIRTSGLSKIMGRNLSLTKLGQWYINSYNYIALFKIFANKFSGFEEIFKLLLSSQGMSTSDLQSKFSNTYNFDWAPTTQFNIRLSWLENMEMVYSENEKLYLSGEALEFAEYLGLIDLEDTTQHTEEKVIIPSSSELENTNELIENAFDDIEEEEFDFSCELDDIVDNLISDTEGRSEEAELSIPDEAVDVIDTDTDEDESIQLFSKGGFSSIESLNGTFDNSFEDESELETSGEEDDTELVSPIPKIESIPEDHQSDEILKIESFEAIKAEAEAIKQIIKEAEAAKPTKHSTTVVKIPNKSHKPQVSKVKHEAESKDDCELHISPNEISELVNLPMDIVLKITSALNMGKHIILTGPHGSGKTSVAVILAKLAQQKQLNKGYNLATASAIPIHVLTIL